MSGVLYEKAARYPPVSGQKSTSRLPAINAKTKTEQTKYNLFCEAFEFSAIMQKTKKTAYNR
jgi:hypothetical protein